MRIDGWDDEHGPGYRLTLWGSGRDQVRLRRPGEGCREGVILREWPRELWQGFPDHDVSTAYGQPGGRHRGTTRRPGEMTLKLKVQGSSARRCRLLRDELMRALGDGTEPSKLVACSTQYGYRWLDVYPAGVGDTQWAGPPELATVCMVDIVLKAPRPLWRRFPEAVAVSTEQSFIDAREDEWLTGLMDGATGATTRPGVKIRAGADRQPVNVNVDGIVTPWPRITVDHGSFTGMSPIGVTFRQVRQELPTTSRILEVHSDPAERVFEAYDAGSNYAGESPFWPAPPEMFVVKGWPRGLLSFFVDWARRETKAGMMVRFIPEMGRPW